MSFVLSPIAPVQTPLGGGTIAQAATTSPAETNADQDRRIEDLDRDVTDLHDFVQLLFLPMGFLLAVLTIGGALSVVFSIRDQRRVSQLHALTVSGEVSSQGRTEQSYSSFLEESQKTLSLVNDTLELAKEATDRTTRTMETRTKAQVNEIETRAEGLMLEVFDSGEFESVVDDVRHRRKLQDIAAELRALDAYLRQHEVALPPYSRFVKAIDQFLDDDTMGALDALRHASQQRLIGDLHRFTLYWIGYMLTTIGRYDEAIRVFRDDEVNLARGDRERLQLERMIHETKFFAEAKRWALDDDDKRGGPRERLLVVAPLLDDLQELASVTSASDDHHKTRTSHEIARTRADIYAWIAQDPNGDNAPLDAATLKQARTAAAKTGSVADALLAESGVLVALREDGLRAWALLQAQAICTPEEQPDFYISFARAECDYALRPQDNSKAPNAGKAPNAEESFRDVEKELVDEFDKHRERRRTVELEAISTICHRRLLDLCPEADEDRRREETRQLRHAYRRAIEAVRDMRQPDVTVFSLLQRRNVSQADFRVELKQIYREDEDDDKDKGNGDGG